MAAIAGKKEIMDHFDQSIVGKKGFTYQIGTLSGNPLAAAAGLKTLEILRREGSYEQLKVAGERLMSSITTAMNEAGIACQIVGEPMLFDVLFTEAPVNNYRDVVNADANRLAIFNQSLRAQGIFKSPGKMYPSLALDEADLVQTEAAIAAAAKSLVV